MESCCARFAAFHGTPHAFEPRTARVDLRAAGALDDARVTVTARGLLLDRHARVEASTETVYDFEAGGFALPRWHADTYVGAFGLDAQAMEGLRGKRVLDLAAGLSTFATEGAAWGIVVDCIDLHFDDLDAWPHACRAIATGYAEQIEWLRCLALHGDDARYRMSPGELGLLERLYAERHSIAERFPETLGERRKGDARQLADVADGTYDLVLCGWLLVHLSDDDARAVLRACRRVLAPDGEARVKAGMGESLWELAAGCLPETDLARGSADDAVIIRRTPALARA